MLDGDKNFVVVGRITTVFGVKGWVKIHSHTKPIAKLLNYKNCFVRLEGEWQPLDFDKSHSHGKGLVAHILDCDDRDQARNYTQKDIGVLAEELPTLQSGEYYWRQLEGLQVWTQGCTQPTPQEPGIQQEKSPQEERGQNSVEEPSLLLGKVDHLLETGSNDVLVVQACPGSIDQRERLIPYRPGAVIVNIELEQGRMTVDWDPKF